MRYKNQGITLCVWLCVSISAVQTADGSAIEATGPVAPVPKDATVRELRSLMSEMFYEQDNHRTRTADLRRQIDEAARINQNLHEELLTLSRAKESLDSQADEVTTTIEDYKKEIHLMQRMAKDVQSEIDRFVAVQEERVTNGIPFEQNKRLARLKGSPADPNGSPAVQTAARMAAVWRFSRQELSDSRSSEIWVDSVTIEPDREQYARLFRVGHQFMGYQTEDGKNCGMYVSRPDGAMPIKNLTAADKKRIQQCIQILDKQIAPMFIDMPVFLHAGSGE